MKGDDRPRSLERPGLKKIFAPLNANERLPRELLRDARRHETVGRRELAGALWLPALVAVLVLARWSDAGTTMTLGAVGILLLGFVVFAVIGERRR